MQQQPKQEENRFTRPRLTKFERAAVEGLRITQIAYGAPTFVELDPSKKYDVKEIVNKEFAEKKIPYVIGRPLPNGHKEHWAFSETNN